MLRFMLKLRQMLRHRMRRFVTVRLLAGSLVAIAILAACSQTEYISGTRPASYTVDGGEFLLISWAGTFVCCFVG